MPPYDAFVRVYQDTSGKWRWQLIAANGERVATSGENFQKDADSAIRAVSDFVDTVFAAAGVPEAPEGFTVAVAVEDPAET